MFDSIINIVKNLFVREHYEEVASGWPEYSSKWHIYEHDRKNNRWRTTIDDVFADARPSKYHINERLMVFDKSATPEEKEQVRYFLTHRLPERV